VKRLHPLRAKGEADEQRAISDLPAAIMRGGLTFTIIVMVAYIGWSIGVIAGLWSQPSARGMMRQAA
jgi:hypothetical protein